MGKGILCACICMGIYICIHPFVYTQNLTMENYVCLMQYVQLLFNKFQVAEFHLRFYVTVKINFGFIKYFYFKEVDN